MKKLYINLLAFAFVSTASAQQNFENLGSQVNSQYPEARPTISADGQTLYFVVEGNPVNRNFKKDKKAQDVWFSKLGADGTWGPATHAPEIMNANDNNAVFWVSPDGNRVLIRGAFENGTYVGRGVSMLYKQGDSWSAPQKLDIPNYDKMSKDIFSGAFMASTGKTILFYFSEEKNSFINDIYVSHLGDDGKWSQPESLGTDINTFEYDEISPYLAADGVTLYFSSDRPGGLGKHDIWMAKRLDESWKKWSTPVNLGPTVNTKGWDAYFALDALGDYAYMASTEGKEGNQTDLVKVKLDSLAKPNAVLLMYGKIVNAGDDTPINSVIYYDKIGGQTEGSIYSNPADGTYKIVLPYGAKYSIRTTADKFRPMTDTIDLTKVDAYKEIHRDLYLTPEGVRLVDPNDTLITDRKNMEDLDDEEIANENGPVTLSNVYFVFAKHYLQTKSYTELDRLVRLLKANPDKKVEIAAHTDWIGSNADNLQLSKDRAEAARQYLIAKGIDASRIIAKGYGETKPAASNNTAEGRQLNRRIEFTLLN